MELTCKVICIIWPQLSVLISQTLYHQFCERISSFAIPQRRTYLPPNIEGTTERGMQRQFFPLNILYPFSIRGYTHLSTGCVLKPFPIQSLVFSKDHSLLYSKDYSIVRCSYLSFRITHLCHLQYPSPPLSSGVLLLDFYTSLRSQKKTSSFYLSIQISLLSLHHVLLFLCLVSCF